MPQAEGTIRAEQTLGEDPSPGAEPKEGTLTHSQQAVHSELSQRDVPSAISHQPDSGPTLS